MKAAKIGEKAPQRERPGGGGAAGFAIRRFHVSDLAEICEVMEESREAARWPAKGVEELGAIAGGLILVAEARSEVIGLLMARQAADEAEILNCAIRRKYRRQGQASALLRAAFEGFRQSGVARVFLEVRESNRAAIKLYEGHGFRETRRRPGYYREPEEAAVCMEVRMEKIVTG